MRSNKEIRMDFLRSELSLCRVALHGYSFVDVYLVPGMTNGGVTDAMAVSGDGYNVLVCCILLYTRRETCRWRTYHVIYRSLYHTQAVTRTTRSADGYEYDVYGLSCTASVFCAIIRRIVSYANAKMAWCIIRHYVMVCAGSSLRLYEHYCYL